MGQKELDKTIGARLKALRITAGLSLNEIAARSGVSRAIADSDDLARVYRFDLAQDSEMISPTIPI
jgi:transcriptional regulator with XRE-family HTH domain